MLPIVVPKESEDRTVANQVLEVDPISKRYGDVAALRDLSYSVRGGEVFGFVGSNGAGKTTTMRIVIGVLAADAVEVCWQGRLLSFETRRHFGYMPEERGLYLRMRVREQLIYLAELHGCTTAEAERGTDAWLAHLDLTERAHDEVQALSHGNQQRAQLAAALVFTPDLLLLDEPFAALDPVAVDVLSEVLRRRAEAGLPVIFSSHQLDLVERLCDRVRTILVGPGNLQFRIATQNELPGLPPRYNIAPSQQVVIVTNQRGMQLVRWGLLPHWAKEAKFGGKTINARAESVATKPSYRGPLRYRRCLIPATGFCEWMTTPEGKLPYHIRLKSGEVFGMDGLYDTWTDVEGNELRTCAIITTESNELMAPIHTRMPVLIRPEDEALWLDPEVTEPERLQPLLRPYAAARWKRIRPRRRSIALRMTAKRSYVRRPSTLATPAAVCLQTPLPLLLGLVAICNHNA